ncbi:TPA: hypothetical protein DCZ32_03245 [Candidatus Uhrbacteria bacterium]|nr:hypothetical protein [Candidatus Uhrbacteria bacterium]
MRLQYEVEIAAKQTIKKLTLQATRTIISIAVKYLGATVGSIFSFTFIAIIIGFGITYLYWNLQLFGWIVARSRGHENWWLLGPPRFLSDIPALFGWEKLTKFLFFIDLCLLILSDTIIFILILDTVVLFLVVILNIMQHPIQTTIGILWDLIMSVFGLVN